MAAVTTNNEIKIKLKLNCQNIFTVSFELG